MRGKLIVIEGSDGSGKKTQTRLLIERAKKEGYKVAILSFPRYDQFWGKLIRHYLDGGCGSLEEVDPKDASMLYAYDRLSASKQIREWLESGVNVILDRYMESNWGHQGGKLQGKGKEEMLRWLYDLEIKELKLPKSDFVIYLNLPVMWNQKAMEKEGRTKDLHEKNVPYLVNVEKTYLELANKYDNWIVIDCLKDDKRLSIQEVLDTIWEEIKPQLYKKC